MVGMLVCGVLSRRFQLCSELTLINPGFRLAHRVMAIVEAVLDLLVFLDVLEILVAHGDAHHRGGDASHSLLL